MSAEFLLTTLIIVATPGTVVLYTLAAGLARGGRASVLAAFACTLGILPHMLAAITGLAALLHTSAVAFQTLKYLGVAYLLWLAWSTLRERGALTVEEDGAPRSARKVIVAGVLINILNPKLTIFFFAFLPQFVDTGEGSSLLHMLQLSAVFMLVTFVVFAIYGLFAAAVRHHVVSRPRVMMWMRRVFAGSFVMSVPATSPPPAWALVSFDRFSFRTATRSGSKLSSVFSTCAMSSATVTRASAWPGPSTRTSMLSMLSVKPCSIA